MTLDFSILRGDLEYITIHVYQGKKSNILNELQELLIKALKYHLEDTILSIGSTTRSHFSESAKKTQIFKEYEKIDDNHLRSEFLKSIHLSHPELFESVTRGKLYYEDLADDFQAFIRSKSDREIISASFYGGEIKETSYQFDFPTEKEFRAFLASLADFF